MSPVRSRPTPRKKPGTFVSGFFNPAIHSSKLLIRVCHAELVSASPTIIYFLLKNVGAYSALIALANNAGEAETSSA